MVSRTNEEQNEYESMTDIAQELYDIIEEGPKKYKHEDIMDAVIGFANMKIFKKEVQ